MDESSFSVFSTDGSVCVCGGKRFADVNVVDRVAHGGAGVTGWASGMCYEQRTQAHFSDGVLNARRYRDQILRPIVAPLTHNHRLILQHDHTEPHVARICAQILEAGKKISQFLRGQHTQPLSMFGMLWIDGRDNVFQFMLTSSNFYTAIEEERTNTQDTDWFSDPLHTAKLHISGCLFIVSSLRHNCAIFLPSNQHLDMPEGIWMGGIISAKEKAHTQHSLRQICKKKNI